MFFLITAYCIKAWCEQCVWNWRCVCILCIWHKSGSSAEKPLTLGLMSTVSKNVVFVLTENLSSWYFTSVKCMKASCFHSFLTVFVSLPCQSPVSVPHRIRSTSRSTREGKTLSEIKCESPHQVNTNSQEGLGFISLIFTSVFSLSLSWSGGIWSSNEKGDRAAPWTGESPTVTRVCLSVCLCSCLCVRLNWFLVLFCFFWWSIFTVYQHDWHSPDHRKHLHDPWPPWPVSHEVHQQWLQSWHRFFILFYFL